MITVEKTILVETLKKLFPVIPQNTSLHVLKNFHIVFANNQLEISVCDLNIYAKVIIPATSDNLLTDEFQGLFDSKLFFSLIKSIPYKTILQFTVEETILNMKTEKGFKSKVYFSDVHDFPEIPSIDNEKKIQMKNSDLITIFDKTIFCADINDSRPSLQSVNLVIDNSIKMVGCDGHKLCKIVIDKDVGEEINVNINKISANFLLSNLNKKEESNIIFSDKHMIVENENQIIYIKISKDLYPNVDKVIPSEFKDTIIIKKKELEEALKMTFSIVNKKTKLIQFKISENLLKIYAINRDIGSSAEQDIEIKFNGEEKNLGFNSELLQILLKKIDTEEFSFSYGTVISPCIFKNIYDNEKDIKYKEFLLLLMPLRILD